MAKKTKPKSAKRKSSEPSVSFEEALEQLKQTVGQLENGNLTLSESLETYEKGVASLKLCYQALNEAQQRIELLVDLDEEGNLVTRPFDNTSSDQMADGSRRSTRQATDAAEDDFDDGDDIEEDELNEEFDELEDEDPNSLF